MIGAFIGTPIGALFISSSFAVAEPTYPTDAVQTATQVTSTRSNVANITAAKTENNQITTARTVMVA